MALLFCDSFDHYTGNPYGKWTIVAGQSLPVVQQGNGRSNTNSLLIQQVFGQSLYVQSYCQKTFPTGASKLIFGFAFSLHAYSPTWRPGAMTGINFGITDAFQPFIDGSGGSFVCPTTISLNAYYYIEIKVDYAAKQAGMSVDGLDFGMSSFPSLPATGNTVQLGSTVYTTPYYAGVGGPGYIPGGPYFSYSYDDIYVCDGTGTSNNDYLGDVQVLALRPLGAGQTHQFSPIGDSANWKCVDDTYSDGDTTYALGIAKNQIDAYNMQNVTNAQGTVNGVQAVMVARKEGAGTRLLTPYVRTDTQEGTGPIKAALGTDYRIGLSMMNVNPATNADWTIADVNNSDFGIKIDT